MRLGFFVFFFSGDENRLCELHWILMTDMNYLAFELFSLVMFS